MGRTQDEAAITLEESSLLRFEDAEAFFEFGVTLVNFAAGLLLLFSCFVALVNTSIYMLNRIFGTSMSGVLDISGGHQGPVSIAAIRLSLCTMILVALNFLVASDVIDTLIQPASSYQMEDLYKLAMIASIRTLLAYFLGKEVEEIEHSLKHNEPHIKQH